MADSMQSTNPRKRPRLEEDVEFTVSTSESVDTASDQQNTAGADVISQPVGGLPAAMRVILALQRAQRHLRAIGVCPTKHAAQTEMMLEDGPSSDDEDECHQVIFCDEEDLGKKATEEQKAKAAQNRRNKERIGMLKDVADANSRSYAYGYMDEPFSLRINRPGCEYDGLISPNRDSLKSHRSRRWKDIDLPSEIRNRLRQWYSNASASGYGDVREQVTKIDESVRTAREIGTSEFTVEDELLRRVENIWKEQFVPGCDVRAEPYKIHLYGPGGHFDTHRDTPQKDLMGTFLVGLGDTSGGLKIDGENIRIQAGPGSCATELGDSDTQKAAEVRRRVEEVVSQLEAPYGILLEHKYCLGTDEFSGFDGLLLNAVRAQSAGRFDFHHLPVVVSSWSVWGSQSDDPYEEYSIHCLTHVYPFTNGHIDFLNTGVDEKSWAGVSHEACGCAWLEGVKDVQFYAVDLSQRTMFPFKHEKSGTCTHLGTEAQEWREDSVYLSYALLVLPKTITEEETDSQACEALC